MAIVPTTERIYYDNTLKQNTLATYAGALLPAAQNMQEQVAEQQSIKIDTLGTEARMKMNDITNQWRIDNESNPTDELSIKNLQKQYDEVLQSYRGQIDPLYRSQWDIMGNKLKGAFGLQNQEWGIKQKQKNAQNDIVRNMKNYEDIAFGYGVNGNTASAQADFEQSYAKLLDYGAKNLGAETASALLNDYEKKYYSAFLSGMIDKNPNGVLNMLKNKDITSGLGYKTTEKFKNKANAQIKAINKQVYNNVYGEYTKNPTLAGFEQLKQLKPNMSKKVLKELEDMYKATPEYEATTTFDSAQEAKDYLIDLSKISLSDDNSDKSNEDYLNQVTTYIRRLQNSNKAKTLSKEDLDKYANLAYEMASDKTLAEQVNNVFGQGGFFTDYYKDTIGRGYSPISQDRVNRIGRETIKQTLEHLANKDYDGAKQVYAQGQRQLIQEKYPYIDFSNMKVGDTFWYEPTQQALKFMGYGYNDILVEVDDSGVFHDYF